MTDQLRPRLTLIHPASSGQSQSLEQPRAPISPPVLPELAGTSLPDPTEAVGFGRLCGIAWRGKWIISLCACLLALGGGYFAYAVAEPKFASSARLVMQFRQQQVVDLESVIGGVSTETAALNTELEVLRSTALVGQVVDHLKLVEDPEFNTSLKDPSLFTRAGLKSAVKAALFGPPPSGPPPTPEKQRDLAAGALEGALSILQQRNSYVFVIRAETSDPEKSARIANALAEIYIDDQLHFKSSANEYAVNWLSAKVLDLEGELKEREAAVKSLRTTTGLASDEALAALNQRSRDLTNRRVQVETDLSSATESIEVIRALIEAEDIDALVEQFTDSSLLRLHRQLSEVPTDAGQRLFLQRAATLLQAKRASVAQLTDQLAAITTSLETLAQQLESQNQALSKLDQLTREAEATRTLYQTFLSRLKETSVQLGLQQADSRLLTTAKASALVEPRRPRIILTCFAIGALIGFALVAIREFFRGGFLTAGDLEAATGHKVIAEIPRFPSRKRRNLSTYLQTHPTSEAAEAIRNLRTSVLMQDVGRVPQVIMSTSSVPGEGKTTMAIALAQNLASLRKHVLVIEGDIRRRTFAQHFRHRDAVGLVSILADGKALRDMVVSDTESGIDILYGEKSNTNAVDLFSSARFSHLLNEARGIYDHIIIDAPPVLAVSDAKVIGRQCDSILYAVLWNRTSPEQVKEGLRQISSVGLNVSGLVLSQIDKRAMRRFGYGGRAGVYGTYASGYYQS